MRGGLIFKILTREEWRVATEEGVFKGSAVDVEDGFIHFSAPEQVRETAAKHFAGQDDLLLVAAAAALLAPDLKWEVSRGGAEFPHLYGHLPLAQALWVEPLPLGDDGTHVFPESVKAD